MEELNRNDIDTLSKEVATFLLTLSGIDKEGEIGARGYLSTAPLAREIYIRPLIGGYSIILTHHDGSRSLWSLMTKVL